MTAAPEPDVVRVGVLLAGGVGARVGAGLPKQLAEVAGRPLIEHTIEAFERSGLFDELLVVMHPDHVDAVRALVGDDGSGGRRHPLVQAVIPGGAERSDSSRLAAEHLAGRLPESTRVFLHDAARPFVSPDVLRRVDAGLDRAHAVVTAVPSADTVIEVRDETIGGRPSEVLAVTPVRSRMRLVQTPQAFRLGVIVDAHRRVRHDPAFAPTDDGSVVRHGRPDVAVLVVAGDAANGKITTAADLAEARRRLAAQKA
ncbi:IspD/TarI family cytidylyltransferase [Pseudoclavibacter sp. 13-3]|uniref:IspD/TarI family cytidylyltransferase n=1 Tax=Pseudoclavibacter sp. 13-3 TaxID=2901228 RepID=UPI001E2D0316|nr:IspD/TarI family cytidylyltransferase [Pseudoclavibacter sp. 13-3]MCD7101678.1 2-C-methyl-D-erythritol 4-phosphate cytidylyltransferase [Pseudoclavibacter sp. 13-3]